MPFGPYKDFADCVSKNKGKVDNPEAYCASIHKKITGKWPSEQSYHSKLEKLHEYLVKNPIQELPKDAVRKEQIMARISQDGKEINMAFEDEEQMNRWLSENPEAKLLQVMGKVKHNNENVKLEEKKRTIKKIEIKQVEGGYGDSRLNKKFVFSNIDEVERHLLDSEMPESGYYKHDVWITYDDGTVEKRRYDHGERELPFGQQLGLEENVNLKEQSERPPKDWWDKCVDRVKSGKPDYTDEQVNAICGSMWYHGWGMGEIFNGKSYSERINDIHKEMVLKK